MASTQLAPRTMQIAPHATAAAHRPTPKMGDTSASPADNGSFEALLKQPQAGTAPAPTATTPPALRPASDLGSGLSTLSMAGASPVNTPR